MQLLTQPARLAGTLDANREMALRQVLKAGGLASFALEQAEVIRRHLQLDPALEARLPA